MDGFGYGGFSGSSYPYWLPSSNTTSSTSASAPPSMTGRPVGSYVPIEELSGPMNFYGYSNRSPEDWPYSSGYMGVIKSQSSSSSFYADNTRPESCGSRGEDSYKGMFSPSVVFTSREVSSVGVVHGEHLYEKHHAHFVPTYNSATLFPGSSSTIVPTCYSQEPSIHSHHVNYNDYETAKAVSSYPVEPDINNSIAPLHLSSLETQASFDGSQTRVHLGDGEPLPSNISVSKDVLDNYLGVQSSLQSSCIAPVNFDALLGSGEATGHSKPLSAGLGLHNPTLDSPCWRGPHASHSTAFDIKSSDSLLDNKPEESSGAFLYPRPKALVGDVDKDALGRSSKSTCENSKANENRYWDHFVVSDLEGPSASKLFKESQSCDTMRVEYGNAESNVSHTTHLSDNAYKPCRDDVVQANPESCKIREQKFGEDKMNVEKMTTLLTGLRLKQRISEADNFSSCGSPGKHFCSLQDLACATSSPKVSLVVNAMHNLSELLVYERSNDGSKLEQKDLETVEKVVKNLTKYLMENTRSKTEAGEASLQKQAMPVSSPNMVKLPEVPKVGATDFQDRYVKPLENQYGGFAFTEKVNKDEMTQNIRSILASNFPDGKETQQQALLFKNLWLEAEAALCSTTCMARFHRIRNEIENLKLHNKESSMDASSSVQEPSLNLQKSVPIAKNPELQATDLLVVDESHENSALTMNRATRSRGFNLDSVDALLAFISGGFLGSSEQGIHGKLKSDANCGKIRSAIPEETPISNRNSHVNDVIDRFKILTHREAKHEHKPLNSLDSHSDLELDKAVQQTDRDEKSGQVSETPIQYSLDNLEALELTRFCTGSLVNDVMERFQILKRREAEHEQKCLNKLDSNSDKVVEPTAIGKTSSPTQELPMHDSLDNLEAPVMARLRLLKSRTDHLTSETCASTDDVKEDKGVSVHGTELSGRGYESPSDWEHVFKE